MNTSGSDSKESACNAGDWSLIPGSGRSLGEENTTNSSILAWKIPWTEEAGGYSPWGCKESDRTEHTHIHRTHTPHTHTPHTTHTHHTHHTHTPHTHTTNTTHTHHTHTHTTHTHTYTTNTTHTHTPHTHKHKGPQALTCMRGK